LLEYCRLMKHRCSSDAPGAQRGGCSRRPLPRAPRYRS
jgi:hypothetical protein